MQVMKIWHQYPFIRILIPFALGIILAMNTEIRIEAILLIIILLVLPLHFWLTFKFGKKIPYTKSWITGLSPNILLFCLGYQVTLLRTPAYDSDNISRFSKSNSGLIITVTEPPVEKSNSFKIIACPEFIRDSLGWKKTSGRLLLYFEKDSLIQQIRYGDELVIKADLNPVNPPGNPGEFDYKQYLSNRGIYTQGYIKSGSWKITDHNKGLWLVATALKLRGRSLDILESNNVHGDEFAVVSALLLGCSDYLDADQIRDYSGSGVMHILSVSGLHVGIIYVFFNFLLAFMDKKRSLKIFKAFLLILMIWFYALITGLSPSVLRASAMFTAIVIGSIINRNAHIYNTLAASAFVLLVYDPYFITSVGFQLSYIAVAGIVWLYRPLNHLYSPRNILLRYAWQTTAVSIAATVATLPLTIYYFRQFPNLFILANLVAIPLSTLIIYLGIFVLAFSPFQFISSALSMLLVFLIKALNTSVHFIENLPFSVIRGICIDQIQLILFCVFVISVCSFFLARNKRFLFGSLVILILMLIPGFVRNLRHLQQHHIFVYNVPKATAIDFISGKSGILMVDSVLITEPTKLDYHIKNNRILSGLGSDPELFHCSRDSKDNYFFKKNCFIQFGNIRMVLIDPHFRYEPGNTQVKVDYLLLSHDPRITVSDLAKIFEFSMVVMDGSNSIWHINQWTDECKKYGYSYYSTRNEGALALGK
jgi:competence protein ComEC